MKVAVVGMIYSKNLGDGVIYQSLKELLEKSGVTVVPLDTAGLREFSLSEEKYSKKSFKTKIMNFSPLTYRLATLFTSNVKRRAYNNYAENIIKSSDAVIIGGGQLITNFTETLPTRLLDIAKICKKYNKPYSIYGCGVGTKFTKSGIVKYTELISGASYVSVRGENSKDRLITLFNADNVNVVPDPVYGLVRNTKTSDEKKVGICYQDILSLGMHDENFSKLGKGGLDKILATTIEHLNLKGIQCCVFTNGDKLDFDYAYEFYKTYGEKLGFEFAARPKTPSELIDLIGGFSHVLSFRMHGAIIAHALNKPTLNIVWDKKIEEVWAAIGSETHTLSSNDFLDEAEFLTRLEIWLGSGVENKTTHSMSERNLKKCLDRMR
ncbi:MULTISPECIES: polysaccharide pyruvyl transferase family protein [Vibrio]|uniref:polysaccharide pyruvyl transferase family protein n=1 Tax=Vibrio TaxID=662 RepID=UPI00028CA9D9|nr:polysaccharide pyruvyl transferase family protein [Vibrio sp. HENC-03]EKM21619.1 polysaccharide pyruvyl transferase family protein [Vibrio sp. HENC-03]